MKLLVLGPLGLLVGQTYSQVAGVDISKLPSCAQTCLTSNTGSAVGCSISDLHCVCSSVPYINAISCCITSSCNATEQKTALAFDLSLCSSFNVTIPNFLGCSPLSSTFSFNTAATATAASFGIIATATVMIVSIIESAFTTTSNGSVAQFTGGPLLTSNCTVPRIATYVSGSSAIAYPWIGCSNNATSCCPFDLKQEGPLSICPMDYFTTDGACCPSGWSVHTSAIAGQTPCATSPTMPIVPPTSFSSFSTPFPSLISNQLFTTRYTLTTSQSSGLSANVIAGIVVGVLAGSILVALAVVLLVRYRRRRTQVTRNSATIVRTSLRPPYSLSTEAKTGEPLTPTFSPGAHSPAGPSELPSPPPPISPNTPGHPPILWATGAPIVQANVPSSPPHFQRERELMELPGSTFIHEHHPIYQNDRAGGSANAEGGRF